MPSFGVAVADALAAPSPPGQWRYMLVDAAALLGLVPELPMGLGTQATDLLTRQRVVDWRGSASPLLVTMPGEACGLAALGAWRSFANAWRYANALTFLEGLLAPTEMQLALTERMNVALPQGLEAMLRYFDNRVLAGLNRVLLPDQRQALLAPGRRWVFADRSGQACTLAEDSARCGAPGRYALALSEGQEAALLEAAEPDAVVDQLVAQGHPEVMRMRPDQQHRAVADAIERASRHGISGNPDLVAFCGLALSHGPDFEDQFPWQELLTKVRAGRVRWAEGVRQVAEGGAP